MALIKAKGKRTPVLIVVVVGRSFSVEVRVQEFWCKVWKFKSQDKPRPSFETVGGRTNANSAQALR